MLLPSTTILVVDDNPHACSFIASVLRDGGYHVVKAHDGHEALLLLSTLPELQLLVTDVVMPGMSGFDLASHIVAARNVPVLFVSAYSQSDSDIPGPLLEKPFPPEALLELVARLLALSHSGRKTA